MFVVGLVGSGININIPGKKLNLFAPGGAKGADILLPLLAVVCCLSCYCPCVPSLSVSLLLHSATPSCFGSASVSLPLELPSKGNSMVIVKTSDKHNVNTRFASRSTFYVPKIRTNYGKFNIRYNGPISWNEIDERFKILTPYSFKRELSLHFINFY